MIQSFGGVKDVVMRCVTVACSMLFATPTGVNPLRRKSTMEQRKTNDIARLNFKLNFQII